MEGEAAAAAEEEGGARPATTGSTMTSGGRSSSGRTRGRREAAAGAVAAAAAAGRGGRKVVEGGAGKPVAAGAAGRGASAGGSAPGAGGARRRRREVRFAGEVARSIAQPQTRADGAPFLVIMPMSGFHIRVLRCSAAGDTRIGVACEREKLFYSQKFFHGTCQTGPIAKLSRSLARYPTFVDHLRGSGRCRSESFGRRRRCPKVRLLRGCRSTCRHSPVSTRMRPLKTSLASKQARAHKTLLGLSPSAFATNNFLEPGEEPNGGISCASVTTVVTSAQLAVGGCDGNVCEGWAGWIAEHRRGGHNGAVRTRTLRPDKLDGAARCCSTQ